MDSSHSKSTPFGDDINATPLSKLQPSIVSKKDMGPIDMPTYNPSIPEDPEPPQQRRVQFASQTKGKQRPVKYRKPQRAQRPREFRRTSMDNSMDDSMNDSMNQRFQFQQPTSPPKEKTHRAVQFLSDYGGRIFVFVLILLVLFMYPKVAIVPYIGNGNKVTFLGSVFLASAASGAYGLGSAFL